MADEVETHAVADVDLEISAGEYLLISGPSGCGKSTLLSILGLLEGPTKGRYRLGGEATERLSHRERARLRRERIGFVFQSFNLIGDLTVRENVELPLSYQGVAASERRRRAGEVLERVGLSQRASHRPNQLSGGQQQRAAVARAIVTRPLILLADEPTGNLDSTNGHQVMELLRQLHREGSTLCVVTHDPRLAVGVERSVELFDGRLVREVPASADAAVEAAPIPVAAR